MHELDDLAAPQKKRNPLVLVGEFPLFAFSKKMCIAKGMQFYAFANTSSVQIISGPIKLCRSPRYQ